MDFKKARTFVVKRVAPVSAAVGLGALLANLGTVGLVLQQGYHYLANTPKTGSIQVVVYDGTRQQMQLPGNQVLLRIYDGNQKEQFSNYVSSDTTVKDLPWFDNFGDSYDVIVWTKGYNTAGFHPVKLQRGKTTKVEIMLLPDKRQFDFTNAQWDVLKQQRPAIWAMLRAGAPTEADARARWEKLLQDKPFVAAHLLNEMTATDSWHTPAGRSLLSYFKELTWDDTMQPDNFFGWADPALVDVLRDAVKNGTWTYAAGAQVFHTGNIASFKELSFWEANVQLTFYNEHRTIDGADAIKMESDLDYYRDAASHVILEVIPNQLGGMTNPWTVYQLRWIASRQAGAPVFDPPYTIVPARP